MAVGLGCGNSPQTSTNRGVATGGSDTDGSSAGGVHSETTTEGAALGANVACPSVILPPGDVTKTVSVGETSRTYVLHVPSAYKGDSAVPLVVDFHALLGTGGQEAAYSTYPKTVDAEGVVMAFPNGEAGPSGNAWNLGPCCVDGVDDVAFARAVVADVVQVACVDPKRVYAVGFSMGGGLAHHLACRAADLFAAVAPAAFDLLQENVADCRPARPITVFSFRGTADSVAAYGGGASALVPGHPITFLGALSTLKTWVALNQCTGAPTDGGDGCQIFSRCNDGVEVALCSKRGGGHEGGDATKSWPVLKRHTLP